jgi:serine/threonine protein kinase
VTNTNGASRTDGAPGTRAFVPGDLVAGRYKIVRLLGVGGTGEVYEAEDGALGGAVALKALAPELAGDGVERERFRREIQAARKITHINVCRIFDIGTQLVPSREGRSSPSGAEGGARLFFTMELVVGETLAARLTRGPRFTTVSALPLATQIAAGLDAAHAAGVVHRDLKPGNIMLEAVSSRVVLTDFGIALSEEQAGIRLTRTGELLGTPAYMAPEQGDLGPIGPATDVYAFGLVLYEMLSGTTPFTPGATPLETVLRRRREAPRPLAAAVPGVDPRWVDAIHRCLARDPARRFSRAGDALAAAVGRI